MLTFAREALKSIVPGSDITNEFIQEASSTSLENTFIVPSTQVSVMMITSPFELIAISEL